jgi:hypothetical protein
MPRMCAQADMEGESLYAACGLGSVGRDPFLTPSRIKADPDHASGQTKPNTQRPTITAGASVF